MTKHQVVITWDDQTGACNVVGELERPVLIKGMLGEATRIVDEFTRQRKAKQGKLGVHELLIPGGNGPTGRPDA